MISDLIYKHNGIIYVLEKRERFISINFWLGIDFCSILLESLVDRPFPSLD